MVAGRLLEQALSAPDEGPADTASEQRSLVPAYEGTTALTAVVI
jgi:hypothetical protein